MRVQVSPCSRNRGLALLGATIAVVACAKVPTMPDELELIDEPAYPPRSSEGAAASGSGETTTLPPPGSGSATPYPQPTGSTGADASVDAPASGGCVGAKGNTTGPIDLKYKALGGCSSVLGLATSNELTTPDGKGRYNTFERGIIMWTSALGAWEVHGLVHDRWVALGREASVVGYPITDERIPPDGIGRYGVFERGSIYWSPSTGAHEVHGRIRDKWKDLGWEAGALGYPTSGEYAVGGGRRSEFEHGTLTWLIATDTVTAVITP